MTVKITYATMSADNEELNQGFDEAVQQIKAGLGRSHPFVVNGEETWGEGLYEETSPIDSRIVVGRYAQGTAADVDAAVNAAKEFFPVWSAMPWQDRVDLMNAAADLMESRLFELGALVAIEVGKNRLEALGDVAETVEFFRYYGRQMYEHNGFVTPLSRLSPTEENVSVLRPYGVWAVISPFNFPMALAGGPSIGALLTGNTVVLKPSNAGALTGLEFARVLRDAGVPPGAFHVVTGSGSKIGAHLVDHPDVAGITFTGSYDVGMGIYKGFATTHPKPAVCEMGGKNPSIVTAAADLDVAAEGVMRAAFGFGGQKCSANSRVYVERTVYDGFVDRLVTRTEQIKVGNPLEQGVYMGPVIDRKAVERFREAVAEVKSSGGQILTGGEVLESVELGRGNFVEPTIVTAPDGSSVWERELFLPLLAIMPVDSLDEALSRSNDTEFGLTAGLFSEDPGEVERFFARIQAGVTYVNRRAGATTGAWPDIQSFGGWKGSGTSGTGGGGPWYLRQYMREQSRTVVRDR
ncbi:MAG: aldehyde dehydrogenase family protein [Actinomycetota bacterium]